MTVIWVHFSPARCRVARLGRGTAAVFGVGFYWSGGKLQPLLEVYAYLYIWTWLYLIHIVSYRHMSDSTTATG